MTDDDKVVFDRKTAAVLVEMARWWQTSNLSRPKPHPRGPRGGGVEMRLAETVDAIPKGETATATLFGGDETGSETDLEIGVEVHNRRYAEIAAGKMILIAWVSGGWEVLLVLADGCVDLGDPTELEGYEEGVDQNLYKTAAGCWALENIGDCE